MSMVQAMCSRAIARDVAVVGGAGVRSLGDGEGAGEVLTRDGSRMSATAVV
jgi:hypothetical protein